MSFCANPWCDVSSITKFREAESLLVAAKGWGEGGVESLSFVDVRFDLGMMEVETRQRWQLASIVKPLNASELFTLSKMFCFMNPASIHFWNSISESTSSLRCYRLAREARCGHEFPSAGSESNPELLSETVCHCLDGVGSWVTGAGPEDSNPVLHEDFGLN